tara:strand:- start:60 stop:386 length:327 start_codon:yes stop_codon:yes gene_type:complete
MNIINTTTTQQYTSVAPRSLKFQGKTYNFKNILFSDENNQVIFKHFGRKKRGAFMKDQVSIIVNYDSGSDTYTIKAKHFDGKTMDSTTIFDFDGMYFDSFADIQFFLN